MREPVASSTGVPNRVLESAPPPTRSSPVTAGPAFSRSTAIANHEPWRTWPWRSARAVITGLSPTAPATLTRPGDTALSRSSPTTTIASTARAARGRRGRGTRAPRSRVGRSLTHDARRPRKVARAAPSAVGRPLRWPSDRAYRTMHAPQVRGAPLAARCHRTVHAPRGLRARDQTLPRPPLRPRDGRRRGTGRGTALRRHRRGSPPGAACPPPAQRRAARPSGGRARRGSGRALPAGGADADRLAVGRHAAQGPAPVGVRLPADLPRAGHGHRADAARVLRPVAHRAVRARRLACSRTSGRCRAPRRTATACCGPRASTPRRSSGLYEDAAGTAAAALAAITAVGPVTDITDDDGVRHRLWVVADEGEGSPGARARHGRRGRPRLHRRRPPPVRDRGPLPGRAPHGLAPSRTRRSTSC